jgi:hypothetical protein
MGTPVIGLMVSGIFSIPETEGAPDWIIRVISRETELSLLSFI